MMQVPGDQIIEVVTVRYCLVPAIGPMFVSCLMTGTMMIGRALDRIPGTYFNFVFLDDCRDFRGMMKMAVMNVINMAIVSDCGMPTLRSVLMTMVRMNFRICHKRATRLLKVHLIKPELYRPLFHLEANIMMFVHGTCIGRRKKNS
jgi:hypothetical protein